MYDAYVVKPKKKKKKKVRRFLFILLIIFVVLLIYYFSAVRPIVISLSEEKVRSLATITISESVGQVLEEDEVNYDDLVSIEYDGKKVSNISANSVKINLLVRKITALVQKSMDNLTGAGLSIALGTFTGIPFLYGIGPMINLKLVPVGTVMTKFDSKFEGAGVNQTKHSLYFLVNVTIGVILPSGKQNFSTNLDILICENIIVGDVPSVYLSN